MAPSATRSRSVARRLHGNQHRRHRHQDREQERDPDERELRWDPDAESRRSASKSDEPGEDRSRSRRGPRRRRRVRRDLLQQFDAQASDHRAAISPARIPISSTSQALVNGSSGISDFYARFAPQLHLLGDQQLHQAAIARLHAIGISFCQVLINTTEDEIACLWGCPVGVNDEIGGPGIARSFVSQLRQAMISQFDAGGRIQAPSMSSPALAGALESLASATHRLKRKRRPCDRDLDSSEDEAIFDLGSVLDDYRSSAGDLRRIPSSSFGDLHRLHQLAHKADRRLDKRVPFIGQSSICLLYTSPSPRDLSTSRMPSSA